MQLFESEWFFKMVESHGKTPAQRLVAIFTIVGQWLAAPGIKETISGEHGVLTTFQLKAYLTNTSVAAGANSPSVLAAQLIILLQGAIAEELRDPGIHAMENAAKAAQAVVAKACQPSGRSRTVRWAAAGSGAFAVVAVLIWHVLLPTNAPRWEKGAAVAMHASPYIHTTASLPMGVNPSEMETVLNLQEQFDRGVCPAPHLLALPPGQLTAYMNAVHFRTPENPEADRANLHAFLAWYERTRAKECYYAPVNGHTLVTWR